MSQKHEEPGRNMKSGFSAVQNCSWYIIKVVQDASKMMYKISGFLRDIFCLFFHFFNILQIVSRNKTTFQILFLRREEERRFLNECEGYDTYLTKPGNLEV